MPNPWTALAARSDLALVRHQIAETGRYYDASRTIVIRKGLLLEDERRYLWHELAHADRRDTEGHNSQAVERATERLAAEMAMPWVSLTWARSHAVDIHEMSDLLKLPTDWVRFRLSRLHPAQKAIIRGPRVDQSTIGVPRGVSEFP